MDVVTSLQNNVAFILPHLSSNDVSSLVYDWLDSYSSHAGEKFNESVTGPSPFQYMLSTSLSSIDANMKLNLTDFQTLALISSWGTLVPWPGTAQVIDTLSAANIFVAPLSNGDTNTLTTAMSIFKPAAEMKFVFSSDFPVGSFKPDAAMYAQVPSVSSLTPLEILHIAGAPGAFH